jgi:hypothetical protein
MSEEGELKKRIHKAYGELDDGICHEECLPNIDKILDVMWSEFPKCSNCNFYVGDGEDGHCTLDDKVDSVGCPKDEWFLRWKGKQ